MSTFKAYAKVITTAARQEGANPQRLAVSILQILARVGLVAAIYQVAYTVSSAHTGISYANAMWSISLCFAFFVNLGIRNISRTMDTEIKNGLIEAALIKPLDWRLVKFCEHLGRSGLEFLIQLIVLPLVLLAIVGPPDLSYLTPTAGLAFILFFFLSTATAAGIFITVGLSAFWLGDANSVYRIVDKTCLVFCGTFVPIALLPDIIQHILRYSPFGAYAAVTQLFNPGIMPVLGTTLISSLIWTTLMLMFCQFVWHRTTTRIEVNGG